MQNKQTQPMYWEANGFKFCRIGYWNGCGYQYVSYKFKNNSWEAF